MAGANYPIWWDTTITIYNRYEDPQTQVVMWYKTILNNCFWQNVGEKLTVGTVAIESNKLICRIPQNSNFLEYYQWVELPNDEMGNYFTVNQGDIIVKGAIDEDINEYQKGSRSTDFIAKYKSRGCLEVQEVSISVGVGRNNPHYHVRGI